ncbi:DUF4105 domain-containing protein [Pseudoflavitalea rhizosphaerae]|uniref:Lnb N-terminal periplasmic domain-containing protein n=1 Tax=Pseudoflavitalea rhizosphaerae TaxID=1884793 RepID=UPI000F8F1D07|nr:DUF4105 domain-containing protein [Pseudoflavitalea rhizosphaerae]
MKNAPVLLFVFALLCSTIVKAKTGTDSSECHLRVSLLTCSPGNELYSTFGHTAIRVIDSAHSLDYVFNYGTFDDRDPQFYTKFTKGIMLYALSAYPFSDFVYEYSSAGRGVVEQELRLTCEHKKALIHALMRNNTEDNRYYNYYFHTDNCTTRARDMITKHAGDSVSLANVLPDKKITYRNLIHQYLDSSGMLWSKFGIDILLGANLDAAVNNQEAMFLPDYLMKGIDKATVDGQPLVSATNTILPAAALSGESKTAVAPVMCFAILLLTITALSVMNNEGLNKMLYIFDVIFFLFLGLLGTLLLTLWLIRVDDVCRNNYNLLWAIPTHLIAALALLFNSRRTWLRRYFRIIAMLTGLVLVSWFFLPQQLNPAIAPVLGLILVRSFYRSK